jgi:peptidoglycan/xylan/chitin deacetylase (PgdA/CDA1 family)
LDRYGVKATFFVVNNGYASVMSQIAQAGHMVAIHSATHDFNRIYASEDAYFNDLYRRQSIIESYTGHCPMMLRFPGGSSNTISRFNPGIMSRLSKLVEEKGFRYFDWDVDSRDAGGVTHGWAEVAYNVIRGVSYRSSSVVLMHDSHGTCLKATERIIQWGLANGYTFVVLDYYGPGAHHGIYN